MDIYRHLLLLDQLAGEYIKGDLGMALGRQHDPSRLALEAIAVTQYELGYRQTRHDPTKLARYIPHLVHLALTPFLGPAETNEFIDQQLKG